MNLCAVRFLFIFLMLLKAVENYDSVLRVLINEEVKLPCGVVPTDNEVEIDLILVFRNNSDAPFVRIDGRVSLLEAVREINSANNGIRVILPRSLMKKNDENPKKNYHGSEAEDLAVSLQNVQISDSGPYLCRVDYASQPTVKTKSFLHVIEPPTYMDIWSSIESYDFVDDVTEVYPIGMNLTLRCIVTGGKPSPLVTWSEGQHVLEDKRKRESSGGTTHLDLNLEPLMRSDDKKRFTCKATNFAQSSISSSYLTKTVQISVAAPPLDVILKYTQTSASGDLRTLPPDSTVTVKPNSKIKLTCEVYGGLNANRVKWKMNDRDVEKQLVIVHQPKTALMTSTLTLNIKPSDHLSVVECAVDPFHPKLKLPLDVKQEWSKLGKKVTILVEDTPYVTLDYVNKKNDDGSKVLTLHKMRGGNVTIACKYRGYPAIDEVIWYHNDKEISSETTRGTDISSKIEILKEDGSSSLKITNIEDSLTGTFECGASNDVGMSWSERLYLNVTGTPICSSNYSVASFSSRGALVNISCYVEANPRAYEYRWIHDENVQNLSRKNNWIIVKTDLSSANVWCKAINSMGHSNDLCTIKIVYKGPPDPLESCSYNLVSPVKKGFLEIVCKRGWEAGLATNYSIFVEERNGESKVFATHISETENPNFERVSDLQTASIENSDSEESKDIVFTVRGIKDGRSYLISIFGWNIYGRSVSRTEEFTASLEMEVESFGWVQMHVIYLTSLLLAFLVLMGVILAISLYFFTRNTPKSNDNGQNGVHLNLFRYSSSPNDHTNVKSMTNPPKNFFKKSTQMMSESYYNYRTNVDEEALIQSRQSTFSGKSTSDSYDASNYSTLNTQISTLDNRSQSYQEPNVPDYVNIGNPVFEQRKERHSSSSMGSSATFTTVVLNPFYSVEESEKDKSNSRNETDVYGVPNEQNFSTPTSDTDKEERAGDLMGSFKKGMKNSFKFLKQKDSRMVIGCGEQCCHTSLYTTDSRVGEERSPSHQTNGNLCLMSDTVCKQDSPKVVDSKVALEEDHIITEKMNDSPDDYQLENSFSGCSSPVLVSQEEDLETQV